MLDTKIPDFSLPATSDQTFSLAAQAGKLVVIYFYPKDSTPGCTTEGQDFSALVGSFDEAGAVVIGVSRDPVKKLDRFKATEKDLADAERATVSYVITATDNDDPDGTRCDHSTESALFQFDAVGGGDAADDLGERPAGAAVLLVRGDHDLGARDAEGAVLRGGRVARDEPRGQPPEDDGGPSARRAAGGVRLAYAGPPSVHLV